MKLTRRNWAFAAVGSLLTIGCKESAAEDGMSGRILLTGSSTMAPLISDMGKRFEKTFPDVRIEVQTGGSGTGIADARSGTAEIGMISRELVADETDLQAHLIARDGVCMIVHKENPVGSLSDQQITDIFTKKITDWAQVNGRPAPIVVVNKAEGRATLEVFLRHFRLKNTQLRFDLIVGENQHGIKTVASDKNAIGYVSVGTAAVEANRGVPIKLLASGNVPATSENVAIGKFPMTRPLLLVSKQKVDRRAGLFIQFAQSAEVRDLIEAHTFVPPRR